MVDLMPKTLLDMVDDHFLDNTNEEMDEGIGVDPLNEIHQIVKKYCWSM